MFQPWAPGEMVMSITENADTGGRQFCAEDDEFRFRILHLKGHWTPARRYLGSWWFSGFYAKETGVMDLGIIKIRVRTEASNEMRLPRKTV